MTRYRKKPVEIEAVKFLGVDRKGGASFQEMPLWLADAIKGGNVFLEFTLHGPVTKINTLEGCMTADIGDWIIQGVKGELYPCKPDIFAATYEKVAP